jgi:hypothetical protein
MQDVYTVALVGVNPEQEASNEIEDWNKTEDDSKYVEKVEGIR